MRHFRNILIFGLLVALIVAGAAYYKPMDLETVDNWFSEFIDEKNDKVELDKSDSLDTVKDQKKPVAKKKKFKKKVDEYKLQPLPINRFASVDAHSRNCPDSIKADLKLIANYLNKDSYNDLEKARAIYTWLTDNIEYNDEGYNSGVYGDNSTPGVLDSKKAVCEGFSNLYLAIGLELGLEIERVIGYAKGYSYSNGIPFNDTNHAWNIIKIDNEWKVFDATWGQGYGTNIDGKLQSTTKFDEYWFNVNPYEAIFTHMPEQFYLAKVSPEINLTTYEQLPYISKQYFEMGFNGQEVYRRITADNSKSFPKCYDTKTFVKIINCPQFENLKIGRPSDFELYIPRAYSVAIIDSKDNWTFFERDKGIFSLTYTPVIEGELTISIKYENAGNNYWSVLSYMVQETDDIS